MEELMILTTPILMELKLERDFHVAPHVRTPSQKDF